MTKAALVVHGHFYQPPRENPWTEELVREPSAAPFHDWNERIAFECYRPNAFARVVDSTGRVVSIVNNYEHLSFDFGPTLLPWLEEAEPEVYRRVIAGDASRGAMAQAYFHVILPLAPERDVRTLVRWGLADFRTRFGRDSEGMWLPETAVNPMVMKVLAEEGVGFTILSPDQAVGHIDPRHAYRWAHPDGARGVDIVFFDTALSHALAFQGLSSQALIDQVAGSVGEGGIVCLATDGETFGHHRKYADRALAYALTVEGPRRGLSVTNAAAYLGENPTSAEVTVWESSWSCVHGVGRWREDCGCSTGGEPGWRQHWRAPLRAALDVLRDAATEIFERRGAELFVEPWAARDAYVGVLTGAASRAEFAGAHVRGDRIEAFTLLESQRHALAMYTSCGWFFNDLAGIETLYVLRHAGRMMDLLSELGEALPETDFFAALSEAKSNDPEEGDGVAIWERHVRPQRVDAPRVAAHLALVDVLDRPLPEGRIAGYAVDWFEHDHRERGALALSSGRVALVHHRTGRRTDHVYAALHFGGLEVLGATRPADSSRDGALLTELREQFGTGRPITKLLRTVGESFGPTEFDLSWALPGAADQILERTARDLADQFAAAYELLFNDHRVILDALSQAGYPLPPELRAPAVLALSRRLESEVAAQAGSSDPEAYRAAISIAQDARRHGVSLDTPQAVRVMERSIQAAVDRVVELPYDGGAARTAIGLLRLARYLGIYPNLDAAQERVYDALLQGATPLLRQVGERLGLAVETLGRPV